MARPLMDGSDAMRSTAFEASSERAKVAPLSSKRRAASGPNEAVRMYLNDDGLVRFVTASRRMNEAAIAGEPSLPGCHNVYTVLAQLGAAAQ